MAKQKVTRSDVARYAGVSTAVVSYVINGKRDRVADATTDRVLNAIDILQYQPNSNARALKLGTSQLLGVITPDAKNPFFAELAGAIEDEARRRGFDLIIADSRSDPDLELRNTRNLVSRQVDALITLTMLTTRQLETQRLDGVPRVFVDQSTVMHGVPTVSTDFREGARMGVQHLIEHGHRNIGLIVGRRTANPGVDTREEGWRDALRDAGLAEGPVERTDFKRRGGYEAAQRLLARSDRPTAVFATSDLEAIGALLALHEAGLRIPADMAIISFDGTAETEFSWPPLSTVRQPFTGLAQAAVDIAINGHEKEQQLTLLPSLVIRRSCGCP